MDGVRCSLLANCFLHRVSLLCFSLFLFASSRSSGGSGAGFLDETVQQNHPALLFYVKQHASDAILAQRRANFVDSLAERSAQRHAQGPAKLNGLDILADPL